jgi:hypothetical protein
MNLKESYQLGQRKKQLEITAKNYDAYPKGLTISGSSEGVGGMVDRIENMSQEVREIAKEKSSEIGFPNGLLERISFNLGYVFGPHTIITSQCSSYGPVNPFTGRALFEEIKE